VPEVIRPDVITCWPRCHDYPLWRQQVTRDRESFGRVIIVFTGDNMPHDKQSFVRAQLPTATFITTTHSDDWYDVALCAALEVSTAEWVLVTEQDFFYTEFFLKGVLAEAEDYDMIGSIEVGGGRIEPSFCLVRRSVLDANDDVGFQSQPGHDNFDAFSQRVQETAYWTTPFNLGLDGWEHMRGLSESHVHAHYERPVTHNPDGFADYLRRCLVSGEPLCADWREDAEGYLLRYSG
jgi:hypothetical protein